MWLPFTGLIIGLILGVLFPHTISVIKAKYLIVTALLALDYIFVGLKGRLNKNFNTAMFTVEFILSSLLAIGLVYLGDIMNTDIFIAVIIVFIARIFYNLTRINHELFLPKKEIN